MVSRESAFFAGGGGEWEARREDGGYEHADCVGGVDVGSVEGAVGC